MLNDKKLGKFRVFTSAKVVMFWGLCICLSVVMIFKDIFRA